MRHPFDLESHELKLVELEFSDEITAEEAASVGGGSAISITKRLGENGGDFPIEIKPDPPFATTEACGEEGGCYPFPLPIKLPIKPEPPIEVTTMAIGEEGGDITQALHEEGGFWC